MKEKRTPFAYDGNVPTNKTLRKLLGSYIDSFSSHERQEERGWREKLSLAWKEIVGHPFASMTEVKSFQGGILRVSVKSSQLLSLLHHREKTKIEQILKTRFPEAKLKGIALKLES